MGARKLGLLRGIAKALCCAEVTCGQQADDDADDAGGCEGQSERNDAKVRTSGVKGTCPVAGRARGGRTQLGAGVRRAR